MSMSFGSRPGSAALCGVALLTSAFFNAPLALAAEASTSLPTVVVTATRTESRIDELVADVTVIDRTTLDRATGRTLVEVLSQQPGMQFSSNGGQCKTASLFIRGLESRHTLLLLDGVRVGSATVGTPSLDNLPLEAVERIEIVRGPMSALYGSDAVGGVVQIITRRGRPGVGGNGKLAAGSRGYGQFGGGLSFGDGALDAAMQVQHTENRGFSATNSNAQFGNYNADNDGCNQDGGSVRLGWQINPGWRVEALALESNAVTGYDDGPGVNATAKLRTSLLSLQTSGRVSADWRTKFSATRSVDEYDTQSSASTFSTLGTISTEQHQFSWENTVATPIGTALALLERIEQDVGRPGAPFSISNRSINAVGLGLNGSAASHTWQASVRHDKNSQFGGQSTGALGYGYEITPAWRAGASYGTSFVAPSFNQLYFPGFGNPNLLPEEGKHGEVSLRWTAGTHNVRAAYFDNRIRGYISSGPAPTNIPRTRIDGITLAYEGRLQNLTLGASVDHIDPRNTTAGTANVDKQLPRRAKNAVRAQADWAFSVYNIGVSWAAFSHRYDNAANTLRLGGYGTLDLRADWFVTADWTLGARLNNVADKKYETAYGFNQPGREAYVTLRYSPR